MHTTTYRRGGKTRARCVRPLGRCPVFLCLVVALLVARSNAGAEAFELNPAPTRDARLPLTVKVFFSVAQFRLTLDGPGVDQTVFLPNVRGRVGASVEWERLVLAMQVPHGEPEDTTDYGRTRSFDVQLRHYGDVSAMEFYLQSYSGYYLEDLPDGCRRGAPCSLRPDLRVRHAGAHFHYVFDPAWSMQSAFGSRDAPETSGGSFILSADVNALTLNNDGVLIPGMRPPLDGGQFISGTLVPAYGHTWVRGAWYVAPIVRAGMGVMWANYSVVPGASRPDSEWLLNFKFGLRLSTGYAGKDWRAGFQSHVDVWLPIHDELQVMPGTMYGEFFVARSF